MIQILKNNGCAQLPLIVYSVADLSEEEQHRLSLGPTAHLTKSRTTQAQLLDTVKKFLEAAAGRLEPKE